MPPERVAVVINLFRTYHVMTEGWASFNWHLPSTRYPNLVYDLHLYYAFIFVDWVPLSVLTSGLFIEVQSALLSRPVTLL